MADLKASLTRIFVAWKTRRFLKEFNERPVSFPVPASTVKNVLVILPRQVEHVDAAMALVRQLRNYYTEWHYMVLDMDKIMKDKLNRLDLPNDQFIEELSKNKFDFSLDLNSNLDIRIAYLLSMLKIDYRLHFLPAAEKYYNIIVQMNMNNSHFKNFDFVVNSLKTIFVKKGQ